MNYKKVGNGRLELVQETFQPTDIEYEVVVEGGIGWVYKLWVIVMGMLMILGLSCVDQS